MKKIIFCVLLALICLGASVVSFVIYDIPNFHSWYVLTHEQKNDFVKDPNKKQDDQKKDGVTTVDGTNSKADNGNQIGSDESTEKTSHTQKKD